MNNLVDINFEELNDNRLINRMLSLIQELRYKNDENSVLKKYSDEDIEKYAADLYHECKKRYKRSQRFLVLERGEKKNLNRAAYDYLDEFCELSDWIQERTRYGYRFPFDKVNYLIEDIIDGDENVELQKLIKDFSNEIPALTDAEIKGEYLELDSDDGDFQRILQENLRSRGL